MHFLTCHKPSVRSDSSAQNLRSAYCQARLLSHRHPSEHHPPDYLSLIHILLLNNVLMCIKGLPDNGQPFLCARVGRSGACAGEFGPFGALGACAGELGPFGALDACAGSICLLAPKSSCIFQKLRNFFSKSPLLFPYSPIMHIKPCSSRN